MIKHLTHPALLAHATIHDEEALTSLELAARTGAKVNEIVTEVNQQREDLTEGLAAIPDKIVEHTGELMEDGTMSALINETLFAGAVKDIASLEKRVDNILAAGTPTEGNTELIDARTSANGNAFATLGAHVRGLDNGSAFVDAVRPGTVRPGRITAGMLAGGFAQRYVIGEQMTTAGKWTGSGYVDPNTLEVIAHSSYTFTTPTACEYGDMFRVYTNIYGNKIPAAIWYDADMNIIGTSGGNVGTNNWDHAYHYVQADKGGIAYVSFQCGTSGTSAFRVLKYTARMYPDPREAMGGRGYIRCYAFNRTDTITDRAQIKMWFPIEEGKTYRFRAEPLLFYNTKGWSVRYFAASSASGYDRSLPESDHGRIYASSMAIASDVTIPVHTEEEQPFTHLAVFIDILANDTTKRIDASIAPPTLTAPNQNIEPINFALHGAVDGDYLGIVPAGAMTSPLWRKRIKIMGDSLARGNTLPKSDSWFNIGCARYDMIYDNSAVNGQAISDMVPDNLSNLDYFVLQGGANDKRLDKPLDGYRAAIARIIDAVRAASPKCKILLMTNWRRTVSANGLGLYDSDYVAAMIEVAEEKGVPCLNNYAHSLNLLEDHVIAWADEGYITDGTPNLHFSRAANEYISTAFIGELERM